MFDAMYQNDVREWLGEKIASITEELPRITPSEWAEKNRYLPASISPKPGYYSYAESPFWREVADCLDVHSPVREVTIMKGVQVGATTAIVENPIGYYIDHVKTAPLMLLLADAESSKERLNSHINPMIQHSGLSGNIKSLDENNYRKTGQRSNKLEWKGGGSLLVFGARNAVKLRSFPVQILFEDETDGYPIIVGRDGDTTKVAESRTDAYYLTRKIVRLSTPLIKGRSIIERHFLEGDQRYYFVPCRKCGEMQILKFYGLNKETGEVWGLDWKMEDGMLVPGSVRYLCQYCSHPHTNSDKVGMFPHGEWRATAKPKAADLRSYHLSAMYSPVSMKPWEAIVLSYLAGWDVENNRAKDLAQLQVFYNNSLGKTFEIRGDRVRFAVVSAHRRQAYNYGEIPNQFAEQFSGSCIQLLTCTVDVHLDNLAVSVMGWTRGQREYLIDYWRFEGDPSSVDDEPTWGRLRELYDNAEYIADDGKRYQIAIMLVDSAYLTDTVYQFCASMGGAVYPIKGRAMPVKSANLKEFSEFTTTLGTKAYGITVDIYKDRWSNSLRRSWNGIAEQHHFCFNAPSDMTDKQLKELTVEVKREKIEKHTGRRIGFEWYRPGNAHNEIWDLLIYGTAALEIIALDECLRMGLAGLSWLEFWAQIEKYKSYYRDN